jgi:hypothetical protein
MSYRPLIITTALIGILTISCAGSREFRLTNSPDVPAAKGVANVSTTDNGNTKIDLVVEHLAPPERVSSKATVYVVWVKDVGYGSESQNLGALKVDKNLKGSITALTNLRSFDLFVTAEPSQSVTGPSGRTLLSASVAMESVNNN